MLRQTARIEIARALALMFLARRGASGQELQLKEIAGNRPLNVVFILSDDHRYDVMSFLGHPWVETPPMDAMAREGVYFQNAMVTTSLCSPSRASILTGQYMHNHGVVDNNVLTTTGHHLLSAVPAGGRLPNRLLRQMAHGWPFATRRGRVSTDGSSFRGQGHYYPPDKSEELVTQRRRRNRFRRRATSPTN